MIIAVKPLLEVIKSVKGFKSEISFNFNQDGLYFYVIDNANVSLISVKIKKEEFKDYRLNDNLSFGLNIDDFFNIIKSHKKEDLTLEIKENQLNLTFSNGFNALMTLINIEKEEEKSLNLEFSTILEMPYKQFKEIIKNSSEISDALSLEFKENTFKITAKGVLNKSEMAINGFKAIKSDNALSKYSIEYLELLNSNIAEKVILSYKTDYPIKLELISQNIRIFQIISPRVEDD